MKSNFIGSVNEWTTQFVHLLGNLHFTVDEDVVQENANEICATLQRRSGS